MKYTSFASAALLATVLCMAETSPVSAGNTSPLGARASTRAATISVARLLKTAIRDFDTSSALAAGFNPVAGTTANLTCPASAPLCVIETEVEIQIGNSATASQRYAICPKIDGSYIGGCPFTDIIPGTGFYQTKVVRFAQSVAAGGHSVTLEVYADSASTLEYVSAKYSMYRN